MYRFVILAEARIQEPGPILFRFPISTSTPLSTESLIIFVTRFHFYRINDSILAVSFVLIRDDFSDL